MILAAALAGLTACTSMAWVRPDATPEQVQQDLAHCDEEAWREAAWRSSFWQPLGPVWVRDAWGRPFYLPYDPFIRSPFDDRFFEEHRLSDFCMRAKGYRLVTIQPSPEAASGGKP